MYPVIVSFFTEDWKYPEHAKRLEAECDSLGLRSYIREMPSRKGYIENSCIKPFFIRDCLEKFKSPILWIDVDGSIFAKPDFFLETDWDFQAKRMKPPRKRFYHVGTMWFNYNDRVREFVSAWCARTGDMTDESALDQTLKSRNWDLKHRDIPEEYFRILHRNIIPEGTVIGHRLSEWESKSEQADKFNKYESEIG